MCNITACTGTFKNHAILSSMSLCSTTISPISNPMFQTMSGTAVTVSSTSLKTNTLYSEMMDVVGLSEGRQDVSETWLWTATSLSGTLLSSMDVCIVHMNNSTRFTCMVCNCMFITLSNSFNNVSTSRSSSRSPPPK